VKDDLRAWKLTRVVWVADRGFCSQQNRRYLPRAGGHYILGEKLRSDSKDARAALARQGRYHTVADNLGVTEVVLDDGTMRDRFVVCHNPLEAERDKAVREQILAQLEEAAGSDALPAARRHDLAKFLLRTSDTTLSAEDVGLGYKQLLEVERAWRDLKTSLELRPIYHRKQERIQKKLIGRLVLSDQTLENEVLGQVARRRLEVLPGQRVQVGDDAVQRVLFGHDDPPSGDSLGQRRVKPQPDGRLCSLTSVAGCAR